MKTSHLGNTQYHFQGSARDGLPLQQNFVVPGQSWQHRIRNTPHPAKQSRKTENFIQTPLSPKKHDDFWRAMRGDAQQKAITDATLGIQVYQSAYAKFAGQDNHDLGEDEFYSNPFNLLSWLFLPWFKWHDFPLTEQDRLNITNVSTGAEWIGYGVVLKRYHKLARDLIQSYRDSAKKIPEERLKLFRTKTIGEIGRAFFTIADRVLILGGNLSLYLGALHYAADAYLGAHVFRALTGAAMLATSPAAYLDAKRDDKLKTKIDPSHKPQNIPLAVRAIQSLGIGLSMCTIAGFVIYGFVGGLGHLSPIESITLLKSSAAHMPILLSLGLAAFQSLGSCYGLARNFQEQKKIKGELEFLEANQIANHPSLNDLLTINSSYKWGISSNLLMILACIPYNIPSYFAIGALLSSIAALCNFKDMSLKFKSHAPKAS